MCYDFMFLFSFSILFGNILAASEPIHAFLEFFSTLLHAILFPSHLSAIVEKMDSGKRIMNPFTMTVLNPLKEY